MASCVAPGMKLTLETNLERITAKCCEPPVEERGAGKPHATFCGNRGWATAPGDPVEVAAMRSPYPTHRDAPGARREDGRQPAERQPGAGARQGRDRHRSRPTALAGLARQGQRCP